MGKTPLLIAAILIFALADIASAATLHGKVYDLELNELNNVVVEVSSEPNQRYVSKDGAYSFSLNPGEYEITADYNPDNVHHYTTTDNISIKKDGDYVYDLFLMPDLEMGESLLDDTEIDIETGMEDKVTQTSVLATVILAIIVLIVLYFIFGKRKKKQQKREIEEADKAEKQAKQLLEKETRDDKKPKKAEKQAERPAKHEKNVQEYDEDLQKMIDAIRKEGGRTTQKDIRKQIPLSEAKISLMISELEHKGVVEKVKKGRGNIIILKK
jgi:uncharacterized membrane protein